MNLINNKLLIYIVAFNHEKFITSLLSRIPKDLSNKYDALSGYQMGVGFTSLLSNHWRYHLGVGYARLNGEYEDGDIIPNVEIPMAPIGSNLEETYLSQSSWQGSIGADYLFGQFKFVRPFVGLYYQYRTSNFHNIIFKFETEQSEELELTAPNTTRYDQNILGLRGGLDFNLSKSIDCFIGVNYNYNLSALENSLLSLNTGVYYHF